MSKSFKILCQDDYDLQVWGGFMRKSNDYSTQQKSGIDYRNATSMISIII